MEQNEGTTCHQTKRASGRVGSCLCRCAILRIRPRAVAVNYLRSAYYRMTLQKPKCSIDTTILFCTHFVYPDAIVGFFVSIGCYCVIRRARIRHRTQIASHVEIPSGRQEQRRDEEGNLIGPFHGETVIGAFCWIGTSATIVAEVGDSANTARGKTLLLLQEE